LTDRTPNPGVIVHGASAYVNGHCRCTVCCKANTEGSKRYAADKRKNRAVPHVHHWRLHSYRPDGDRMICSVCGVTRFWHLIPAKDLLN
jgi:hypothetical protein